MRAFGFVVLAFLAACQSPAPLILNSEAWGPEKKELASTVVGKVAPSVVSVYGSGHSCGLLFDTHSVLTVAHGAKASNVIQSEAGRFPGTRVWRARHHDACVLDVLGPKANLLWKTKKPLRGESVLVVGRRASGEMRIIAGQVILDSLQVPPSFLPQEPKTKKPRYLAEAFVLKAPARPGDSGAPIFNFKGELLGIVVAGNPKLGVTLAASAGVIFRDYQRSKAKGAAETRSFKSLEDELRFIGESLEAHGKTLGKYKSERLERILKEVLEDVEGNPKKRRAMLVRFWRAFLEDLEKP